MSRRGRTTLTTCSLLFVASHALAQVAGNDAALSTWQAATGVDAPAVVDNGDGTTRLEWTGNAHAGLYARSASGDALVTPYTSGHFYAVGIEGEWHSTDRDGSSWLQLAAAGSNDRALLPQATQLDSFQAGRDSAGLRLVFGDVAVLHSALGTSTSMRGVSVEAGVGKLNLSLAAGVIGPSWEALAGGPAQSQPLRNALAVKATMPLRSGLVAFATAQAFDDSAIDPKADTTAAIAPAKGQSITLGASFARPRFSLQAEAGLSNLQPDGGSSQSASALRLDATWKLPALLLRAGHHDLGRDYASLSVRAIPGLRESYLSATWSATATTALSVDLRDTTNRRTDLAPTPTDPLQVTPARSRAATLRLTAAPASLTGTTVTLSASRSAGTSANGAVNDLDGVSATVDWVKDGWTTSLGYQLSLAQVGTPMIDSRVQGWTAMVGRSFDTLPAGWSANLQVRAHYQRQDFSQFDAAAYGGVELQAEVGHARWGSVRLVAGTARGHDSNGVALAQQLVRIDAERAIARRTRLTLYAGWNENFPDTPGAAYGDTTVGVQLHHQF